MVVDTNITSGISDYIHLTKYARFLPSLGRRETFLETVARVEQMHLDKYPNISDLIHGAFNLVRQKKLLPSMRSMQFAGDPIIKHNARMYNCCFTLIDRPKAFSEIAYILMCGGGVGYSVQPCHVSKLPKIRKTDEHFMYHHIVDDSIEGWSDAIGALITGAINGFYVEFSYNKIRPSGSSLTSGGYAPGHIRLKLSINNIRSILTSAGGRQLTTLECHDIICHIAGAIIVGGIRSSSMISLFSPDDRNMLHCKGVGEFEFGGKNAHRAMANNSAVLRRFGDYASFVRVMEMNRNNFGDPGFVVLDEPDYGINPCLTSGTLLLDNDRLVPINQGGKTWTSWKTGKKTVIELHCNNGLKIKCTPDHQIMLEDGVFIEAKDTIDHNLKWGLGSRMSNIIIEKWILTGFLFGDGYLTGCRYGVGVKINNDKETDVCNLLIKYGFTKNKNGFYTNRKELEEKLDISLDFLENRVFDRAIPDSIMTGESNVVTSFLRGLFEANGSVKNNHQISFTTSCHKQAEQVQILLASFGVISWINGNEPKAVKWLNGTYISKKNYRIQISQRNAKRFEDTINFYSERKKGLIKPSNYQYNTKLKVVSITDLGVQEVWDYRMNVPPHHNFCQGLIAKNCGEVVINPVDRDGNTGFGFCNLVEINAAGCHDGLEFFDACKAASIIATLQAGYNKFPYLGQTTENIVRDDPLIGVSITGMMDNPWIFNETILSKGAKTVLDYNEYTSAIIGVNQSPRCTCIKPSGNSSLELGCVSSGVHPHHAKRYFRRVVTSKMDPAARYFAETNPHMVEIDDDRTFLVFPIETSGLTIDDLNAIQFLEKVCVVHRGWISAGVRRDHKVSHNVSCTVTVKDSEWDEVTSFVWSHGNIIGGLTFFPYFADQTVKNCPRQAVIGEEANRKFDEMVRQYKNVDYTKMTESTDNTTIPSACDGDSCSIQQTGQIKRADGCRVFLGVPTSGVFNRDGMNFTVVNVFDGYFIARRC